METRRNVWRTAMLLLFSGLFTSACEPSWTVSLEQPLREIPEDYLRWFSEVASCMGRPELDSPDRFGVIQWYHAVEIRNESEGKSALGLWREPHRITIRSDLVHAEYVIKHELVHELLRDGSHRSDDFDMCAGSEIWP